MGAGFALGPGSTAGSLFRVGLAGGSGLPAGEALSFGERAGLETGAVVGLEAGAVLGWADGTGNGAGLEPAEDEAADLEFRVPADGCSPHPTRQSIRRSDLVLTGRDGTMLAR